MTSSEAKILAALAEYPQRSAARLKDITGLSLGTIYPTLMKLENAGKIQSRQLEGYRPRRRIYWVVEQTEQPLALDDEKHVDCDCMSCRPWTT